MITINSSCPYSAEKWQPRDAGAYRQNVQPRRRDAQQRRACSHRSKVEALRRYKCDFKHKVENTVDNLNLTTSNSNLYPTTNGPYLI